eukprot:TRINITY_DN15990_c0_g1::TRINITY_DN15990_c0_g1_i1::g.3844::m.3844 TRINITY_DN15990_c0_g1::TRINITY_DN15990_c0_g1_i1::g.3844  ORF type:complete len:315 (-),score=62.06,sp/Q6PBN2/AIDA_DANRE/35.62/2e-49,Aida_C2/PF14186.1/9.9e-50,Aida_N/PF08910.5/2.8e-19,MIT/PF04212.13/0.0037,Fibrillarin/PF01269.12/0.18 TRINITY_DN15990_c0_g1_i1:486-1403(-)
MSDRQAVKVRWLREFTQALDSDSWGQMMEAIEGYEKLVDHMTQLLDQLNLSHEERAYMSKLIACLQLRIKTLQSNNPNGIKLDQMQMLRDGITNLFTPTPFPLDLTRFNTTNLHATTATGTKLNAEKTTIDTDSGPEAEDYGNERGSNSGSLLGPPPMAKGNKYITIHMDKIGLKDATTYIDPSIRIHVCDRMGDALEMSQETASCNRKKPNYVIINQKVHIQTPINAFSEGTAIIFEFRHWKPKKKKVSTRCWTFLDNDELKPGPAVLELYAKPMRPKHKKKQLNLFSIKQLYFHLDITIDECF